MATNQRKLKAFVRYDGSGRVIPGGPVLSATKPKVGNWKEIDTYECCNYSPISYNFDITADWSLTTPPVVDEASFRTFLESGQDGDGNNNSFVNVMITNFSLVNGRLRCNLVVDAGELFGLSLINVTELLMIGNITGEFDLYLYSNNLTTFDPTTALPEGLTTLDLGSNSLTEFNPTFPLPSILGNLYLGDNSIISFDPSLPLPSGLGNLGLSSNNITEFNPTLPLPSSLESLAIGNNQIVTFNPTLPLPSSLLYLDLDNNQIVTFNPTVLLPDSILYLNLGVNQMTTAGYIASESWANAMSVIPGRGTIALSGNVDSVSGTDLEAILISKGWTVNV